MMTKAQYIAQARTAHPKPQYATINGEQIELTDAEYETSLAAWADMRIQQDEVQAATAAAATARETARTKLAALGLTEAEIAALVG